MNRVLAAMKPYTTKQISALAQQDPDIVSLSIGEPWFGPAPFSVELLKNITGDSAFSARKHLGVYIKGRGDAGLRDAIAARYKTKYGIELDPNKNVLVSPGGSTGFVITLLTLTDPGDDVLIPDPTYMLYSNTCTLLGRNPVRVRKHEKDGFILSPDAVRGAVTPHSKLLIVNSPENPTGAVHTRAELQELNVTCRKAGVVMLHDEVYDSFVFEGEHVPAAIFDPELAHTMHLNSMSKRFGMPGLRIGWLVGNKDVIDLAERALEYVCLSVTGVSQYLAEKIMREPSMEQWIASVREDTKKRRDLIVKSLSNHGFRFPERGGAGGFFLFPNITEAAYRAGISEGEQLGERFAAWLIDKAKVAVVPGGVYGASGANHVRFVTSIEEPRLELALERIARALG